MTTSTPGRPSLLTRAVVSLATVTALTAGVPTLLIRLIGDPIPETWNWNSPVTDEVLLGLVGLLAWIFWAQFVLCLVVEIGAEVRIATGRSADWLSRVPGTFTTQQALARTLVEAVIAVGIGAATVAAPLTPDVARASAATTDHTLDHTPTTPSEAPRSSAGSDHVDQADRGVQGVFRQMTRPGNAVTAKSQSRSVTVAKGDSLWTLAERHLGSGEQWRRIAALNSGRTMVGGQTFRDNTTLQPGWTLLIPAASTNAAGQAADFRGAHRVTVEPGDSLWSLSEAAYGDGDEWGRLYAANRDHITDPDLIYPQQQLRVPSNHPTHPATASPGPTQRQPAETHVDPIPEETARGPASPPPAGQRTTPDTRTGADAQDPTTSHQTRSSNATQQDDDIVDTATMIRALSGGGLLLASGVFTALLARRRRQFRNRRSGLTITPTPQALIPTERAVRARGSAGGAAAQFLDHALRDLATRARRGECNLPEVAAARLSETALELVVTPTETVAPTPWTTTPDGSRWHLSRDIEFESTDAMAPYPTLVAVGLDDQSATWLIDLEAAGIIQLTGDRDDCQGLIRYMAAELATNAWSDDIDVIVDDSTCQLIPINPSRFEHLDALDLERLTKTARRIREATETTGLGVLAGRADGRGGDTWLPTVLLSSNGSTDSATQMQRPGGVEELAEELSAQERRSAVAFVSTGLWHEPQALVLRLNAAGLLENPWATPLRTNTLSHEEALALGQLFEAGEDEDETSGGDIMPASTGDRPADSAANAAGALRDELTEPRNPQAESPHSLLPEPDAHYLQRAATTTEDLQALAPGLSPATAADTRAIDPDLDADLNEWRADTPRRPRLRVLGPVELQVRGPRPADVERRVAYYTELVAYLALRPKGTPPLQMAEAFNIQANTLHSRINALRKWLGTNDSDDAWYLPESTLSSSARARGVPIYQLSGVLCDADLYKRLRARGQTRGAEGIGDLVRALELVEGAPFDQLRPGGYGWLADSPHDHYLTAAIVDTAHVVATDALSRNDTERAAWAAGVGITAAPSEDKPRLDLARARTTQPGAYPDSSLILNRTDDNKPPPPPTARTQAILLTPATEQSRRAADG